MSNEERILSLLETMNGRLERLESGQSQILERLDVLEDKLDDVEAKNANQHIRTRSSIERLASVVKDNTFDIAQIKAAK